MGDRLSEAATIALVGVAVVMVALTILMLAIMALNRLAPDKKKKKGSTGMEMPTALEEDEPVKESVAAIAVAMALAMEGQKEGHNHGHGESPVFPPMASRWSAAGRERLMGSRLAANGLHRRTRVQERQPEG